MKKELKSYLFSWSIALVLFNLIIFITPNTIFGVSKFTSLFWIAYATITLSFVIQLLCTYTVSKAGNLNKLFLNLPVLTTSIRALIATLVVGVICMIIPVIPTWIGIIVCAGILGYYVISILQAKEASNIISDIDDKIKVKTLFLKSSAVDIELMLDKTGNVPLKKKISELAELFKYSDPVSHPTLQPIEQKIEDYIAKLDILVVDNSIDDAIKLADEIKITMEQRNKKCMLLK